MRILVSNDDGITAPGLAALRAAVDDLGDVTVVAPNSPQSAAGHAITVHAPLTVKRLTVPQAGEHTEFTGISVDGRPADCVRLAIRMLLPQPPDLVLSGINNGANVGINVFYSGTVAAAAEAAMFGIPAVAFSASAFEGPIDFVRAASLCRAMLDQLISGGLGKGDLINVNIPALGEGPPKGVRTVPQSTAGIDDAYLIKRDAEGGEQYHLGEEYKFIHQADTDVSALADGYITVTPLHVDMTTHLRLETMARGDWPAIEQ
jgi:5'-nucleotidase